MALHRIGGHAPQVPASAFLAPEVTLIGQVRLGERTSVWFAAVVRGDNETIDIGDASNVQEGAVLRSAGRAREFILALQPNRRFVEVDETGVLVLF